MADFTTGVKKEELKTLDMVVKETIKAIEGGKERIFAIAENARSEYMRVRTGLGDLNEGIREVALEIAALEKERRHGREPMDNIIKLTLLKERQAHLIAKREEFEQRLAGLEETAGQAENLVSQVGVVMDFIGGNLQDINVKIESIQQRQQLGLQVIKAQEEERKRVAREIHDGPAQSMANVVLRMEFCEKLMDVDPDKVRQELRELKEVVRGNLQDVRKIIFDLRPMALDDLGLIPALRRYLEDYREKYGLVVETNFKGAEKRMAPALEIALFRLIQEALNNVRKHASARKVEVTLDLKPKMITAGVKDDGRGFDLKQVLAAVGGDSFGLISMKERAELLGGRVDIKSAPGQGTEVIFRIPVAGREG